MHANLSNAIWCVKRLGKDNLDIVTAATTPAHRSCSTDDKRSIFFGVFSGLGLIHRTYLVFVFFMVCISLCNCERNLEDTVRDEFLLVVVPFFILALAIGKSMDSNIMIALELRAEQSTRSCGKLSMFFVTKFDASYSTEPAK
jgi:hypothetical protein